MDENKSMVEPVTLYGSTISYFTGKMENYFRVCGIPYRLKSMQFPAFKKRMEAEVGSQQLPVVILPKYNLFIAQHQVHPETSSQMSLMKITRFILEKKLL